MILRLSCATLALLLVHSGVAQSVAIEQIGGIGPRGAYRHDVGLAIRDGGFGNYRFVTLLAKRDHSGWATNPNDPSTHLIDSVYFFVADTNAATANQFTLWIYAEDLASPGTPAAASAQGPFGPFQTPGGGTGALYYPTVFQFPTPVAVSNAGNVYIGFEFSTETQADHLSCMATSGIDLTGQGIPVWDAGNGDTGNTGHGQGTGATGGYTLVLSPATSAVLARWEFQLLITPMAVQPGFHVGATTSQATWPISNGPATPTSGSGGPAPRGFTTSFFSALQPSLLRDRNGNPRADDLYLLYENPNLPPDTLVGFLLGGLSPAAIGLDLVLPGSTGAWCLDPAQGVVDLGQAFTNLNGFASVALALGSNTTRAGLIMAGISPTFTAVALDFINASAHAGPCSEVTFF